MADWRDVDRIEAELNESRAEAARLRAAIEKHWNQKADDRCVFDDTELYEAAGLPAADHRVGDKLEMIKNCERFIERRCEGGGWPSYAELEREVERLRRETEFAEKYRQDIIKTLGMSSDAHWGDIATVLGARLSKNTPKEPNAHCGHVWGETDYGGAKCVNCHHLSDYWFCPTSPTNLCWYGEDNESCNYCGEPEERK